MYIMCVVCLNYAVHEKVWHSLTMFAEKMTHHSLSNGNRQKVTGNFVP